LPVGDRRPQPDRNRPKYEELKQLVRGLKLLGRISRRRNPPSLGCGNGGLRSANPPYRLGEELCHKYSDNALDIRPRYRYKMPRQSRSVRTPPAEGTLRRRGECGARGRGHTLRSRAAWVSVPRHDDRGGRCFPGLGQAKAGNARSDHVPGSLA
jgi:hypothetical protein